jgi:hypothetical protein
MWQKFIKNGYEAITPDDKVMRPLVKTGRIDKVPGSKRFIIK